MFDSRGQADRSPGSMIIWGIGFLLIFLVVCAAIYMFVVKFLMRKGKKEEAVVPVDSGDSRDSGAFENPGVHVEPLSVKVESEGVVEEEKTKEVCQAPLAPNPAPNPAPKPTKSISLSKEELSSGVSQTDVAKDQKPLNLQNPEIQNPQNLQNPQNMKSSSAEMIPIPIPIQNPNLTSKETDKKPVITSQESVKGPPKLPDSKEKIPESEASGYQMSSQRSEVNNVNMIEAGRTPPTDSRIEMIELTRKDSLTPVTTAIGGSETAVSMTTPPIQMKK